MGWRRIWKLRYFWSSLVVNDITRRYRRSFLGVGWSLARPLGMTLLFGVIFGQLLNQDMFQYAPFLLIGLTLWQFLVESALQGCHCFHNGAVYIRQEPLPLVMFPLRVVLATGFHASIALGSALVFLCLFQGVPSLMSILMMVPGLVLLFFLAWALATLTGLLHTLFPDTHHLLELALQVTFYLTPILYPPDLIRERARLAFLLDLNPLSGLIHWIREPLVSGQPPTLAMMLASVALVACVAGLAWRTLKTYEKTLVFWI